ncbi:hypothetical protein Cni_G05447 [Canna indica]|uniref:C2 domain-containing protein n=1 Tax=Canna indica TaxID=4628 RepID=A0AAQ3JZ85_9LILI|nr:hypothetical protein Cni_G05447 [Canna indica]
MAANKIHIEVCLISARGLHRAPSFLKPQWFAVGWIDPNNKYCTKIDASGDANPTWNTKFAVAIDEGSSGLQGLALTVEVYKREPIFLREKLQGTAVIPLNEFLVRFLNDAEASRRGMKESGSFQLRKKNYGKPHGFVDVSIAIADGTDDASLSRPGVDERLPNTNNNDGITLAFEEDEVSAFRPRSQSPSFSNHDQVYNGNNNNYPYSLPRPRCSIGRPQHTSTGNNNNASAPHANYPATAACIDRPAPPPPPPPPCNAGFLPTLFPGAAPPPQTYINLPPPSSRAAARHRGGGAEFGVGLGAGALAAGAVIFGDDFMSGSQFPMGLDGGSLTVSSDTLF